MSNVVYLISSLPSLTFGQLPPISLDNFHSEAKEQLSPKIYDKLQELDLNNKIDAKIEKLKNFAEVIEQLKADVFEIRNAKNNDRSPAVATLPKTVLEQNPLEREKSIMKWQWEELNNINTGEIFTVTEVFVYKLKLQILHRLNSFNAEKGLEILESVVNPPKKKDND
jgi:DNA-directed RNA polymerase specialized sigma subunit